MSTNATCSPQTKPKKKKNLFARHSLKLFFFFTEIHRLRERELKMDKKLIVRSLYRSLCSRSYHVAAVSHTLLRHHHHHLASPSRSLFSLSSPSPNRLLSGTILFPIPNLLPINPKTHFSLFINFYIFFAEIANFKN